MDVPAEGLVNSTLANVDGRVIDNATAKVNFFKRKMVRQYLVRNSEGFELA